MKTKEKEKNTSIMQYLQVILIIMLIIVNIVFIRKVLNQENRVPTFMGIRPFVIISGSMDPQIKIGDMVLVDSKRSDYEKGDIIAFREGSSVIVHRINEIVEDNGITKYKTKGDNNNTTDYNLVEKSNIEGKYKCKIPKIGLVFIFIYKYFLYIIAILLIIMIIQLWKQLRKRCDN